MSIPKAAIADRLTNGGRVLQCNVTMSSKETVAGPILVLQPDTNGRGVHGYCQQ